MKLRTLFLTASALWALGSPVHAAPQATVAGHPVLWSVHFDADRLRTGVGQELFASLDPILTTLSSDKSSAPGGKLQSLAIYGFEPQKGDGHLPFLADLRFSADGGGIARRFEAISKKRNLSIETVAGSPALHFQHEGKEIWIAKLDDTRIVVCTSRGTLELALAPGANNLATALPSRTDEVLGGDLEIKRLLADHPDLRDSELLSLLPHLEFHVLTAGENLDVDASAELDNERSARRAARMIDGMVAGISLRDTGGVPWDERVSLKQEGARLAMRLHLEPQEARKLFDLFAREIENHKKAPKDDE